MNKHTCQDITDLLIDFADGTLPVHQQQAVAAHLADCQNCRDTAAALQQSLDLAQVLWMDTQNQIDASPMLSPTVHSRRLRRIIWQAPVAIAASLAILLLARQLWRPATQDTNSPHSIVTNQEPRTPLPDDPRTSLARIELNIEIASHAATLLAAADTYLADQPRCQEIAQNQYAFIAKTFAGTVAADTARQRLESFPERRTLQ